MIGRARLTAASSAFASLVLASAVIMTVGPVISANAGETPVEPCHPGECEPVVTVTITETPGGTQQPANPSGQPVVTATVTVTPTPAAAPPPAQQPADPLAPQPVPQLTAPPAPQPAPVTEQLPNVTEPANPPNNEVTLPQADDNAPQVDLPPASQPEVQSSSQTFEEPTPETATIEMRNASPAYDKASVSQWLAIPAAVLVVLALAAWLLFEQRLRRMVPAAALGRGRRGRLDGAGAFAVYPSYPGYTPMVSFMPVQPYPVQHGYPLPYGYPSPYVPQGYPGSAAQAPAPGQPVPGPAAPVSGQGVSDQAVLGQTVSGQAVPTTSAGLSETSVIRPNVSGSEGARVDRTVEYPLPGDPTSAGS